jgi:hypothetical protein
MCLLLLASFVVAGTTGKISGTVVDAQTGEKLVGANVLVEGTRYGAVANVDGYYAILNLPPGLYKIRVSLVGYQGSTVLDARVIIDQTTTLDFGLRQTTLQGEEVVIVAQRPIVQKDVAASQANITTQEIANLPVTTVASVVGLQAGVQGDVIRGGGNDQTAFVMDGFTLRNERDNSPYTAISLSSVQEVQVQTGGFNAEYGNIRSGIINVVTKEGGTKNYSVSITARMSPPTQKYFGSSVYGTDSYFIRPFVDPVVAWTGTKSGAWDTYMQQRYPTFDGWNAISERSMKDPDPKKHLTPEAAQQLFLFQHRRTGDIVEPDWDLDGGVGGPFPAFSEELGNLRFFAAYRQSQSMYVIPLSRDRYRDYNGQLKVTTDLTGQMKLMAHYLQARQTGTTTSQTGTPGIFTSTTGIVSNIDRGNYLDSRIYSTDYWAPTTIDMQGLGLKLTHVLSSNTYYEITLDQLTTKYNTNPGRLRNTDSLYVFGNGYLTDESPFGYFRGTATTIDGMQTSLASSQSRDSSKITVLSSRAELVSQVDRYNQLKAGAEVIYTDNRGNYGSRTQFESSDQTYKWHTYPLKGALYVQDKLEFQGMIANLGVRVDYLNPGGYWYSFSEFTPIFTGANSQYLDSLLPHQATKKTVTVSPRLGVAFPITEYAKLFFNYGHFRQMPFPENLFLIRYDPISKAVSRIANPNDPLMKTVAYELGYEHSFFEEFLLRVSGYYKDVTDQPMLVTYSGKDERGRGILYSTYNPVSYEDIRGFELTLSRNRGTWVTGSVNYTYMVSSNGRFGYQQYDQNADVQRQYEKDNISQVFQSKPVASPYGRFTIDFFTPSDLGSPAGDINLFGDWRLNLTGRWQSGDHFSWNNGGSARPGYENNVQWKDYYNVDMRFSKTFNLHEFSLQLFMDVSNLFNFKNFSHYGFTDANNFNSYMTSLHLPSGIGDPLGYGNIPGSDQPGDVCKDGVTYTPVEFKADVSTVTNTAAQKTVVYYDQKTGRYMENQGSGWTEISASRKQQILDDKSYIFMPNMAFFTFLNPRDIFWGVKFSFNF